LDFDINKEFLGGAYEDIENEGGIEKIGTVCGEIYNQGKDDAAPQSNQKPSDRSPSRRDSNSGGLPKIRDRESNPETS
jgi:hypothetical protein